MHYAIFIRSFHFDGKLVGFLSMMGIYMVDFIIIVNRMNVEFVWCAHVYVCMDVCMPDCVVVLNCASVCCLYASGSANAKSPNCGKRTLEKERKRKRARHYKRGINKSGWNMSLASLTLVRTYSRIFTAYLYNCVAL